MVAPSSPAAHGRKAHRRGSGEQADMIDAHGHFGRAGRNDDRRPRVAPRLWSIAIPTGRNLRQSADSLIWGRDWPVLIPKACMVRWRDRVCTAMPVHRRRLLSGGNATRVYRLERPS
jgi:hypothetical protein